MKIYKSEFRNEFSTMNLREMRWVRKFMALEKFVDIIDGFI